MEAEQARQAIFVLHIVVVKVFTASDSNLRYTKTKTEKGRNWYM